MQIKFGKFILADHGLRGPADIEWSHQRAVQVDDGPRWEHPQFADRKNRVTTLRFSTTRIHDSLGDAESFAEDHNEELPVIADLITEEFKANGSIVRRTYKGAALQMCSVRQRGITTVSEYQFLIGEPLKTKV